MSAHHRRAARRRRIQGSRRALRTLRRLAGPSPANPARRAAERLVAYVRQRSAVFGETLGRVEVFVSACALPGTYAVLSPSHAVVSADVWEELALITPATPPQEKP